jgi:predicted DNA-binding transcriptional regulator AlpA
MAKGGKEKGSEEGGTRLLRVEDVLSRLNISDRYFRYLRQAKAFPEPDVRMGRSVRWSNVAVERWFQERMASGGKLPGRPGSKAAAKDSAAR